MSLSPHIGTDDPTVEELEQSGRRMGIVCGDCSRFRYMKTGRFAADIKVSTLAAPLRCAACGSKTIRTVAISPDKDTGFWPAERS